MKSGCLEAGLPPRTLQEGSEAKQHEPQVLQLHSRPFILMRSAGHIINSAHNYEYLWCAWQLLVIWRNKDQ